MVHFFQYPNATHHFVDPNLIFLKVNYTLLLSGDVELNPGPRTKENQDIQGFVSQPNLKNFKKVVLGNFNQGHEMFGSNANKQGATNSLFSICWTTVRNINIWKDFDLDYILHKGNMIFKDTGLSHSLQFNEIPMKINVENYVFKITIVSQIDSCEETLSNGSQTDILDESLFFSDQVTGVIFFINGHYVSILKERLKSRGLSKKIYIFDPNSLDKEGDVEGETFKSILIEISTLKDLSEYLFATYGFHTCKLAYVNIAWRSML